MLTTLRETYLTAKKEHICEFCACKIHIGQKYIRQTNVYDGTKYDFITHQECKEVARKLRMYDDCDDEGLDGESFRETWIHTYTPIITMMKRMTSVLIGSCLIMK